MNSCAVNFLPRLLHNPTQQRLMPHMHPIKHPQSHRTKLPCPMKLLKCSKYLHAF